MIKVVLADDEAIIVNGIVSSIDWAKHDMTVSGVATDGEEALEMIEYFKPDIFISDISMPLLSGLDVTQRIRMQFPDMYIVLISGYDDFNYARRAIQLNVFDYVLKPIDIDALDQLLYRIRDDYSERQKACNHINALEQTSHKYESLAFNLFIRDIIYQNITDDVFDIESEQFECLKGSNHYCVIIAQLEINSKYYHNLDPAYAATFFQNFKQVLPPKAASIITDNLEFTICMYNKSHESLMLDIRELTERYSTEVKSNNYEKMNVFFGIGNSYPDVHSISTSFREAKECLNLRFMINDKKIIHYNELQKMEISNLAFEMRDLHTKLIDAINETDVPRINAIIDGITEKSLNKMHSRETIQLFWGGILVDLSRLLQRYNLDVQEITSSVVNIYNNVLHITSLTEAMKYFCSSLIRISKEFASYRAGRFDFYIEKTASYIDDHYMDSAINLDLLAHMAKMSPSYFSSEFKRIKGKTYITYLTCARINHAKKLLRNSSMKVNEIAKAVGYENSAYFGSLFKKITLQTPKEYRLQNASENNAI